MPTLFVFLLDTKWEFDVKKIFIEESVLFCNKAFSGKPDMISQ